jgi:hypothetical protein
MKITTTSSLLALAATLLVGCVGISIGNKNAKDAPPPPAVVVVASEPGDQATLAEINAAAGLNFENARTDALRTIAQRPNLTPACQVQLANQVFKKIDMNNDKVAVLVTLINNPAFSPPAKQTIMAQLSKLSFDNDRQTILKAVNEREKK